MLSASAPYLGAPHADDPVHVACGIVEIGDSQSVLAGRDPVPFGGRVDLENMGPRAEDWLLPTRETKRAVRGEGKLSNGARASTSWHCTRVALCTASGTSAIRLLSGDRRH